MDIIVSRFCHQISAGPTSPYIPPNKNYISCLAKYVQRLVFVEFFCTIFYLDFHFLNKVICRVGTQALQYLKLPFHLPTNCATVACTYLINFSTLFYCTDHLLYKKEELPASQTAFQERMKKRKKHELINKCSPSNRSPSNISTDHYRPPPISNPYYFSNRRKCEWKSIK